MKRVIYYSMGGETWDLDELGPGRLGPPHLSYLIIDQSEHRWYVCVFQYYIVHTVVWMD